jgi:uncharacterized protein YjeT (DUF2065 family)
MNWTDLLSALGLMLVIEGIMPFASPASWRRMMQQITTSPDNSLRGIGAMSMVAGLLILYFVRF